MDSDKTNKPNNLQEKFKVTVDAGEASAIALAHETENSYLIVDDVAARKLCAKFNLPFMGTFGLLLKAKEYKILDAVKPLLDQIKETNFRMSDELYQTVLQKAGE